MSYRALADAIRRGAKMIPETRSNYCGCALGTGYMYKTGRSLQDDFMRNISTVSYGWQMAAKEFGIPEEVARLISNMHYLSARSREQCADYLDSLADSLEPAPRESDAEWARRKVAEVVSEREAA